MSDASGNDITSYKDAGLTNIANLLEKKAPPGQGNPGPLRRDPERRGHGRSRTARRSSSRRTTSRTSPPRSTPRPRPRRAPPSPMHPKSSMVAIQPSTGKILAIANNAGFNDYALTAKVAPGSTMKVITSTALISSGVLSASQRGRLPARLHGAGDHLPQRQQRVPAGRHPVRHRLRPVLQQRVQQQWPHLSGGGLATRRQEVLRPQPALEHRHHRRVRHLLQRPGQRQRLRAGPGGVRRGPADRDPARDGLGGGHRVRRARSSSRSCCPGPSRSPPPRCRPAPTSS